MAGWRLVLCCMCSWESALQHSAGGQESLLLALVL
jgi:hypothetical protein